MPSEKDWFTPRVSARTALARALKQKGAESLRAHRLKESDLDEIIRRGDEAQAADADQKVQLAESAVARAGRKVNAAQLETREEDLSATMRAVILDLAATSPADAGFLAKVSFARYRVRVSSVDVKDATGAEVDTLKAIERVPRADIPTRARGLAALCRTLRGRDTIVTAFADRGLTASELDALAADADEVSGHGRNELRGVEATAREAAAVAAQSARWSAVKSLVRRACADDLELSRLLAGC